MPSLFSISALSSHSIFLIQSVLCKALYIRFNCAPTPVIRLNLLIFLSQIEDYIIVFQFVPAHMLHCQTVNSLIYFTIFIFIPVLVRNHTITSYLFYTSFSFGSFQKYVSNTHFPFLSVPLPIDCSTIIKAVNRLIIRKLW